MMLSVRIAMSSLVTELSAFFCRSYSLGMRVICGKHVNISVVWNSPCVIWSSGLLRPIGCPGSIGPGCADEQPGPPLPEARGGCALATSRTADFVHLFTNDVS
jgi:hypothetical protein